MAADCRVVTRTSWPAAAALLAVVLPAMNCRLPACRGQGYEPGKAASQMRLADGLTVTLFASEPVVRQPILVKVDDRGRLWTIQYLQYPNPAGLKRVKVDRWSRTVYDRIPKPPPHGPKGADRITILEDTDGDGRADRFKDFVGGLNLATGLEFGHGGAYVLQVPYLLFYPDADRDDVPDGEPKVLLSGFGMEDAQSLANHLTWGPDGWLYGLNGSTTTCNIRGIEFQQGVWRYHPLRDEFELFCEGGGNLFGLTFDAVGNLFYSSNGGLFYHALQGAYYEKNFGKHGALHNLYAYGYLEHVENSGVQGTPTTGGIIYLGQTFPEHYRGAFLCGDFLGHTCSWWNVEPAGTTVRATRGGTLLDSRDTWFGPTDLCYGPDGAVYVCDFHDRRTAHPDPDADWDRTNGRIYRIEAPGTEPVRGLDLSRLPSEELVSLLEHSNHWYGDRARVVLAERREARLVPSLETMALAEAPQRALQGLWGLYATAGLRDPIALGLLEHSSADVRRWTVRLLGDAGRVAPEVGQTLVRLATTDGSAIVRQQLAATARRLPADVGLPIVHAILDRDLDDDDPRTLWTLWWAIESKAVSDRPIVLEHFARRAVWENGSWRGHARRLVRRYAAEGTVEGYGACLTLIRTAPAEQRPTVHAALAQGLAERSRSTGDPGQGGLFEEFAALPEQERSAPATQAFEPLTDALSDYIERLWSADRADLFRLELALRGGVEGARASLLLQAGARAVEPGRRAKLIGLVGKFGGVDGEEVVLPYVGAEHPPEVQVAAVDATGRLGSPSSVERLLAEYGRFSDDLKSKVRAVLLSRRESAGRLLAEVDAGRMPATEIPLDQLRMISLHGDEELDALVRKHWGNVRPGTAEEKLATMRRLSNDLRAGAGDAARGRVLFDKTCATCHRLFGEGKQIGPDLTETSRGDREALLANLVDPSAVVRRQYLNYVVVTGSGRVVTGLIAEQNAASVTLLDAKGERIVIARDEIEELRASKASLMPERLLEPLSPQELRDLFAYLPSSGR